MPTFNQLVRKGRQTAVKKSTAPALQRALQLFKKESNRDSLHHRNVVFVQQLRQLLLRNLTQLLERSPEFVFPTESK